MLVFKSWMSFLESLSWVFVVLILMVLEDDFYVFFIFLEFFFKLFYIFWFNFLSVIFFFKINIVYCDLFLFYFVSNYYKIKWVIVKVLFI